MRLWTARKKKAFLKALRDTGIVTAAAEKVKVSRSSAYQLRKSDPVFRQGWDDAVQAALDVLEAELRRRAVEGVEQPVYFGGKECGRIRTYNDTLGMFLLRAGRGEVYAAPDTGEPDGARKKVEDRLKRLSKQKTEKTDQGPDQDTL